MASLLILLAFTTFTPMTHRTIARCNDGRDVDQSVSFRYKINVLRVKNKLLRLFFYQYALAKSTR